MSLAAAAVSAASAQPRPGMPVVGYLSMEVDWTPGSRELIAALSTLGHENGRTMVLEARFLAGREAGLQAAVEQLVAAGARLIVAEGRAAASAALRASRPVPVVAGPVGDARDFGITDLSRPAGLLTGITMQQDDTDAKVASLLKELVPGIARLAVLRRVGGQTDPLLAEAARLGLSPIVFELPGPSELPRIFSAIEARADSLVVAHTAGFAPVIGEIAAACLRARIPAASSLGVYARAGLLMAYSSDIRALKRRVGVYVDRLLKGASISDLPIEQPSVFNLVVNAATARALGVAVPPALLARVGEFVE